MHRDREAVKYSESEREGRYSDREHHTMESEFMEQDVTLDGNEDLMSTSNTSTNGAGSDTNGCGKKTVCYQTILT